MRIMMWILGVVALLAIVAGAGLQFAVTQNGPAVLSTLDRAAGGSGNAAIKARVATGADPAQKLIVWGPVNRDPGAAPLPVLVFAHGGSWRAGNPDDYGFVARAFVPEGFVVVLVGYRLHPQAVYPAMLEDTASAIAWTHREIAAHGGDPDRITLAGHSAGAYNVVMTALEGQWLARSGLAARHIAGVIGMSGPYDFVPFDSESTIAAFGHVDDPQATQPVTHARSDAPPMLLLHGEADTLVKPRNTRALARRIETAGGQVETHFYPSMEHNDPLIALAAPWRSRRDVVEIMARFARRQNAQTPPPGQTSVPVQDESR